MEIKIVPITNWVGKVTTHPRKSQFKKPYAETLKLLKYELEKAGIHGDAQLQMFISPNELRLDGNLRATAKPMRQGVKLVFKRKAEKFFDEQSNKWKVILKTVSYPCDAFDNWKDNLRGIALSMVALRQVERYGVFVYDDIMDRLALPQSSKISSAEEAAVFISDHSNFTTLGILKYWETFVKAYREAAKKLHPDKGGDGDLFIQLNEAKRILDEHFN